MVDGVVTLGIAIDKSENIHSHCLDCIDSLANWASTALVVELMVLTAWSGFGK